MTFNATTTISANSEWNKLLIDPPAPTRWPWQAATPQPQPGKDLDDALKLLVKNTLDRATDPTLEQTYQESINDVYSKFKARVSQFTVASGVCKGILLKSLVGSISVATIDLLMKKYCRDEMKDFRLNLQPSSLTEAGKIVCQIEQISISDINAKILELANLSSAPNTKKTKKELYQALVNNYKPQLEKQIKKLEDLDKPFIKQVEAAFLRDVNRGLAACKSRQAQLEQGYSEQNLSDIQERLKQFQQNLGAQEALIKEALQLLKPELLKDLKGFLALDESIQNRHLQAVLPIPALANYRIAKAEVEAQHKTLTTFLSSKEKAMAELKTESNRWAIFQASAAERGRYTSNLIFSTRKQYQQLLFFLENQGDTPAAPNPITTYLTEKTDSAKALARKGAYATAVALGVCVIYAAVFYGGRELLASSAGRSTISMASTSMGYLGEVVASCSVAVNNVISIAQRISSAITTASEFVLGGVIK